MSLYVDIHLREEDVIDVYPFIARDDLPNSFVILGFGEVARLFVEPHTVDHLIDAATEAKRLFEEKSREIG